MSDLIWNSEVAKRTAQGIIQSGSYHIDFNKPKDDWIRWTNGVYAPCYVNCRYLTNNAAYHRNISQYLSSMIISNFSNFDLIVGLATGGMFWGANVSTHLNLPFAYVRSTKKDHGVGNLIEGYPKGFKNAILIDDTIASGGSLVQAEHALLNEYDIKVRGIATICAMSDFNYVNRWGELQVKNSDVKSLTNYLYIQEEAGKESLLTQSQIKSLNNFYINPTKYKWEI